MLLREKINVSEKLGAKKDTYKAMLLVSTHNYNPYYKKRLY
jgi:hypothetical protein